MLGFGWTEMLVIGVMALIVIGPKDLPAVMHRVGKFAGTIRRMGSEFQRELNKTTGLNEIRNLRSSITQPLKATTDAIRKEFNTTAPDGSVQPSGALKPADPSKESVVDEIKAAAGMSATTDGPQMTPKTAPVKAAVPAKTGAASKSANAEPAETSTKKTATRKSPAKTGASKSAANKTTAAAKTADGADTAAKPARAKRTAGAAADKPAAKPRARKAATAADGEAVAKTTAPRKPKASKAGAAKPAEAGDAPVAAAPRKRSPAKKA